MQQEQNGKLLELDKFKKTNFLFHETESIIPLRQEYEF